MPKQLRTMQWGEESQCSRCRGWWPADTEFFRRRTSGRLSSWCCACESEHKKAKYYETAGRASRPTDQHRKAA